MKRSEHRILTTHVGSLIRPKALLDAAKDSDPRIGQRTTGNSGTQSPMSSRSRRRPASTSSMTASSASPAGPTTSWSG